MPDEAETSHASEYLTNEEEKNDDGDHMVVERDDIQGVDATVSASQNSLPQTPSMYSTKVVVKFSKGTFSLESVRYVPIYSKIIQKCQEIYDGHSSGVCFTAFSWIASFGTLLFTIVSILFIAIGILLLVWDRMQSRQNLEDPAFLKRHLKNFWLGMALLVGGIALGCLGSILYLLVYHIFKRYRMKAHQTAMNAIADYLAYENENQLKHLDTEVFLDIRSKSNLRETPSHSIPDSEFGENHQFGEDGRPRGENHVSNITMEKTKPENPTKSYYDASYSDENTTDSEREATRIQDDDDDDNNDIFSKTHNDDDDNDGNDDEEEKKIIRIIFVKKHFY